MLNLLTATALDRLQTMRNRIAVRKGIVDYLIPDISHPYSVDFFETTYHVFEFRATRESRLAADDPS